MSETTIAAIATPAGRGGVGIVRISGSLALPIAQQLTGGRSILPRHVIFSSWQDANGKIIDQGITLYFPAPNSYTGEDVIELQAHGSPPLLVHLLKCTFALGASPALPGEFTRRAVLSGKMNLSQAEAVAACIDAATLRAAQQAQRHLQGAFGSKIERLMDELTGILASIEACLDFPEEDIPEVFFPEIRELVEFSLLNPLTELLETASLGERLFQGAHVAFIGSPNVGKSSLLNSMVGYERAIVSEVPGTTRDIVEMDFEVDGIPVRLLDTAGIRDTDDRIEQEGVRRARDSAKRADVVVYIADASRPETWSFDSKADIWLMNKMDISSKIEIPDIFLPISALSCIGLDDFRHQLALMLGSTNWGEESLLVTRERHRVAIERSIDGIRKGLDQLGDEGHLDIVALEWRRAWAELGEILGLGDVDTILDRVFSEFCIGK